MKVELGVFAYNEAKNIQKFIINLSKQNLFTEKNLTVKISILANGCTDNTVELANLAVGSLPLDVANLFDIQDLTIKGKSNTWNYFCHHSSNQETDYLFFLDADITFPERSTLAQMLNKVRSSPTLKIISSKPVKDISLNPSKLNLTEKLIEAASGSFTNFKTSICGQLYLAEAKLMRSFYLPQGLPVEDGFVRAMSLTNLLTDKDDLKIIDGEDSIFHQYDSIRTISGLIRHQARIVIGSAINKVIYDHLKQHNNTP
jgi:glycosyltransferase involved in cell wall biosynthesis